MHKHTAAPSRTFYSRCVTCLVPMAQVRKRGQKPYWTARNTARTAILAGPVWDYTGKTYGKMLERLDG